MLEKSLFKPLIIIFGVLLLLLASPIIYIIADDLWQYRTRKFDPIEWRNVDPRATTIRFGMFKDFERRYHVIGMDRNQLVKLLGEPAPPGFPFEAAHWDMTYQLAPSYMDHFWLLLRFKNGKVSEYKIYED